MVHVTCLAHGLHRVAEVVRRNYPEVNRLISSSKSIFLKAPLRVQTFRDFYSQIPLPPSPVITRWGTWLKAAQYHSTHLEKVTNIVTTYDADEAQSIAECQQVLDNAELNISLSYISANFNILAETIEKLETRGLALGEAVNLIEKVEHKLKTLYEKQYYDKLQSILR